MNPPDITATRFLLADDHSLIRQGIIFLLEDLELEHEIFQASNLQQLWNLLQESYRYCDH
jgi:DNA-binding NarL/FixJ family response regulator